MLTLRHFAAPACLGLFLAPAALAQSGAVFEDVSEAWGVDFKHFDVAFGYAIGGGNAWIDYDGDGDEDLFCGSADSRNRLFRNDGPGSFADVTLGTQLDTAALAGGIAALTLDHDSDGDLDLYIASSGQNQLFSNDGAGVFTDLAPAYGLNSTSWGSAASAADFDRDGDLDIYVGNYVQTLNFPYHFGAPNEFYLNTTSGGVVSYDEQAAALNIDDRAIFGLGDPAFPQFFAPTGQATAGCTLSICTLDYDEDGDPDLMVGNDFGQWVTPNRLYRNDVDLNGTLAFTDVAPETGFDQRPHYNMGILGRDYDHDGDWDFYKTNLGDNLLLRNDNGIFTDVVYEAGPVEGDSLDAPGLLLTSWSIVWEDFDNDGFEDLYVVNGLIPAAGFIANDARSKNGLYLSNGDGTFSQQFEGDHGAADEGPGRGAGAHDVNRDGFLDMFMSNNGANGVALPSDISRLYLNRGVAQAGPNGFTEIRLRSRAANWEAIGARVDLWSGDLWLKRQVLGDPVFVSSASRELHFGLGDNGIIDRIAVEWPTGTTQEIVSVPAGLQVELLEPIVLVNGDPLGFYDAGAQQVQLQVEVHNTSSSDQVTLALVQLVRDSNGRLLRNTTLQGIAPGGGDLTLTDSIAVPSALIAAVAGETCTLRIYVFADGAWDSRETVVTF